MTSFGEFDDIRHGSGGYLEGEEMAEGIDELWSQGHTLCEVADQVGQTVESVMDTLEAQYWDYHDERNVGGSPAEWQIRAIIESFSAMGSDEAPSWNMTRLARALKLDVSSVRGVRDGLDLK